MAKGIAGFFQGGGKSVKFPNIGDEMEGIVTTVHEPEEQTDFDTGQPIPGKLQIRIELQTDDRDPDVEGDDGKRTLYVKGWMIGAIREALQKCGVDEPEEGGKLWVRYVGDGPSRRPGLQGPKQYEARYTKPGIFKATAGNGSRAAVVKVETADAPIPTEPPAGIDAAAWQSMPAPARQAIANTMAGLAK